MNVFSTILQKLGIQKPAAPAASGAGSPAVAPSVPASVATARPAPMAMVDVVSKLNSLAEKNPGLDWKVSIVDMLKLLGMDSSLNARKELANELGCPPDLIGGDYAKMNVWLHDTVLKKISENGGNIPQNLLH